LVARFVVDMKKLRKGYRCIQPEATLVAVSVRRYWSWVGCPY
jgi:hypothetical protein